VQKLHRPSLDLHRDRIGCHNAAVKRLAVWAVAFPSMLAGTLAAHAIAYRLVYPVASVRWHVLATSGHGYLGYAPLIFGISGAVVAAGLASTVADAVRGRTTQPLPAWAFALLPLVGFTIQEFAERSLASGTFAWWTVEQPTFRVGLLLQLPFALAAYVFARLVLRVGRTVGAVLARRTSARLWMPVAASIRPATATLLPLVALQRGWSVRGPPLPSD